MTNFVKFAGERERITRSRPSKTYTASCERPTEMTTKGSVKAALPAYDLKPTAEDSCCNIAITLIISTWSLPEGTPVLRRVNECNCLHQGSDCGLITGLWKPLRIPEIIKKTQPMQMPSVVILPAAACVGLEYSSGFTSVRVEQMEMCVSCTEYQRCSKQHSPPSESGFRSRLPFGSENSQTSDVYEIGRKPGK